MSTAITSTEVLSTTTTSYAWTGTVNASPSVQRVNGTDTRRNDARDPQFSASTNWYMSPKGTYDFKASRVLRVTAASAYVAGDLLTYPSANLSAAPGEVKGARYRIRNTGTTAVQVYGNIRAYSDVGASGDGETTPLVTIESGDVLGFELPSFELPPETTGYRPLLRVVMAQGASVEIDQPQFESLQGDDSPGFYFDGASPTSVVVKRAVSRPLVVDGYQSSRPGQNVFQQVLGSPWPDVSLFAAGPRTGTLTMVYATEAEALEAERMHLGTNLLTFSDSDLPSARMTYVLNGTLGRQLDPATRALWLVTVDFQEVKP